MADEKVILDCGTGEIARVRCPQTSKPRNVTTPLGMSRMNEVDAEESTWGNVIGKLAEAAGVSEDDVKLLLGTGGRSRDGGERPQRPDRVRVL